MSSKGVVFGSTEDLAFPGDNRGDAVCEISIEDDRCVVRGRTGATAEGRPRQARLEGSKVDLSKVH